MYRQNTTDALIAESVVEIKQDGDRVESQGWFKGKKYALKTPDPNAPLPAVKRYWEKRGFVTLVRRLA
jgi:hypothetical protein